MGHAPQDSTAQQAAAQTGLTVIGAGPKAMPLSGIQAVMHEDARAQLTETTADYQGLVALANKVSPDAMLVDVDLPGLEQLRDGGTAPQEPLDTPVHRMVLMLDPRTTNEQLQRATATGSRGLVATDDSVDEIIGALQAVRAGSCHVSHRLVPMMLDRVASTGPSTSLSCSPRPVSRAAPDLLRLTERENQVLSLLAEGLTDQAISIKLYIGQRTVKYIVQSLLQKFQANNRAHVVAMALRTGCAQLGSFRFGGMDAATG